MVVFRALAKRTTNSAREFEIYGTSNVILMLSSQIDYLFYLPYGYYTQSFIDGDPYYYFSGSDCSGVGLRVRVDGAKLMMLSNSRSKM